MDKKSKVLQCAFFSICFVGLCLFLTFCKNQIDSDFAGEMIFSKLIAREGGIFSKNWYYSTEINLLHTPLIMSIVFRFLNNWHAVRVVTGILILALMMISYFYYCAKANHHKYSILFGTILVLPFSWGYLKYVLFGYYYLAYIIISFFCLGMIYSINSGKKDKNIGVWIVYLVLSFLAGLGTIRQLVVLFYPLCLAVLILMFLDMRKECNVGNIPLGDSLKIFFKNCKNNVYARYFFTSCAGAFVASVGYVLNVVVLRRLYSFNSYDRTEFIQLDYGRQGEIVTGLFGVFGYEKNQEILSIYGITDALVILMTIVLCIMLVYMILHMKQYKVSSQICIAYFVSAVLVNLFLFTFANLYAERYMIPYIVFFVAILNIFMEEGNATFYVRKWVRTFFMFVLVLSSLVQYGMWIQQEDVNNKDQLIQFIEDKNYEFGMGSFWNCNIITELTDGKVAMRNVYTARWDTLENEHWLVEKSYEFLTSDKPMFILLSVKEFDENKDLPHFSEEYVVYSDHNYYVFEYANSDALCEIAGVDYTKVKNKEE